MGWERKRGALTEFNELLTGSRKTSYSIQIGELSILNKIKYVITLDADTQLPRDNAKKLIGAMAHPLNTPVLNAEGTRVVAVSYTHLDVYKRQYQSHSSVYADIHPCGEGI